MIRFLLHFVEHSTSLWLPQAILITHEIIVYEIYHRISVENHFIRVWGEEKASWMQIQWLRVLNMIQVHRTYGNICRTELFARDYFDKKKREALKSVKCARWDVRWRWRIISYSVISDPTCFELDRKQCEKWVNREFCVNSFRCCFRRASLTELRCSHFSRWI